MNNLREDIVTIQFGRKLGQFLETRDGDTVIYTRDQDNTEIDPDSGVAWWKVAARYYLQRILPDRADGAKSNIRRTFVDCKKV